MTVEEYIAGFSPEVQKRLEEIRNCIKAEAPQAEEVINYGIPTFKLRGNLVHYAAFSKHIGFYPGASGIAAFKEQIRAYKNAKGSVQFPFSEPLPTDLIAEMVRYRVREQNP